MNPFANYAYLTQDADTRYFWLAQIVGLGVDLYVADDDFGASLVREKLDVAPFQWPIVITKYAHYFGALSIDRYVSLSADPYTGSGSSGSCSLRIKPDPEDPRVSTDLRNFDRATAAGISWDACTVTLLRCASTDTRITASSAVYADTIFVGKVDDFSIDSAGDLILDCVGLAEKYDTKLPTYVIDKRVWADSYKDDRGRKGPILYGVFTDVEAPQVNKTDDKVLVASHHISSRNGSKIDDVSTSSTLSNTTDSRGRSVALFDFSDDIGDGYVTAAGVGHKDDAAGTYTGTVGGAAVISNPADQLHHLAAVFAGIPGDYINRGSFVHMRTMFPGYTWTIIVGAEDERTFFDIAAETCQLLQSACVFERGRLRMTRCITTAAAVLDLVDGQNCEQVIKIKAGEVDKIVNSLTLHYDWGWIKKKKDQGYREVVIYDEQDSAAAFQSQARYGLRREEIDARCIRDDNVAAAVAANIIDLKAPRRMMVECIAGPEAHLLNLFDVVTLTTTLGPSSDAGGWTKKRFVVTGMEYQTYTNKLTLMEC